MMNAIRSAMTVFLLAVLAAAILGWRWVAALPPAKSEAARIVLSLAAIAAIIATTILWRAKPRSTA
jgi:membrane protein YdbS with pleckstrin-like domain